MTSRAADKRLLSPKHLAKPLGFVFSFFSTKQNPKDFADFALKPKPLNIALSALFVIARVGNSFAPQRFGFYLYTNFFSSVFPSE